METINTRFKAKKLKNKFHKIQQNEIERIRGIVLKIIYTCDFDIDDSSEPSSNKL